MAERILDYYSAVLRHIETLRYEIEDRRGGFVHLRPEEAREAVQACLIRGSLEAMKSRPAVPVPPQGIDWLEEKALEETEGLAYAIGYPLMRDPERNVIQPMLVLPLDILHDGQGNLRAVRKRAMVRSNGAVLEAGLGSYAREANEREAIAEALGLETVDATTLAGVADGLEGERVEGAALYAFADADYLYNLRQDYAQINDDFRTADVCLRFLLRGHRPPLDGEPPVDVPVLGRDLTPSQHAAVGRIYTHRITPIEGPPGTGKTTLIANLCAISAPIPLRSYRHPRPRVAVGCGDGHASRLPRPRWQALRTGGRTHQDVPVRG